MTQDKTNETPERIWACPDMDDHTDPAKPIWEFGHWDVERGSDSELWHEYTRTDIVDTRVREAVEAEREACALIAEQSGITVRLGVGQPDGAQMARGQIAAAIRERGEKK